MVLVLNFYILLVFVFVFVTCLPLSVFLLLLVFRELFNFEICFASFVLIFKEITILSFSVLLKNFGKILLF